MINKSNGHSFFSEWLGGEELLKCEQPRYIERLKLNYSENSMLVKFFKFLKHIIERGNKI